MTKTKKQISIETTYSRQHPAGNTVIITPGRVGEYDIADLRNALTSARRTISPSRTHLYDLYEYACDDPHLSSVLDKRRSNATCCAIKFLRGSKEDERISEMISSPWFDAFIDDLLSTYDYGFSLFQFYIEDGWVKYDLIPRKNVCPHRRLIFRNQSDTVGIPFDTLRNMLFVGDPKDLGRLRKVVKAVVYKNNNWADFANFAEQYGQPIKEGVYDGHDDEARERMVSDLYNMGGSAVFVHPKGTEITLHDSASKGASATLYDTFINLCNKEISKAYLGNTLTTDVGNTGTQALGTVHDDGEQRLALRDKKLILNTLNYYLTDIFTTLGYRTSTGKFIFDEPNGEDLESRYRIDAGLRDSGLPIDDDYFYEKYNVPKPKDYLARKEAQLPSPPPVDDTEPIVPDKKLSDKEPKVATKKSKTLTDRVKSFFAQAPRRGALEW